MSAATPDVAIARAKLAAIASWLQRTSTGPRIPSDWSVQVAAARAEVAQLRACEATPEYVDTLIELARGFMAASQPSFGGELAREARRVAASINDEVRLRLAILVEAGSAYESGDFERALEHYIDVLEITLRLALGKRSRGAVWLCVQNMLESMGAHAESIVAAREALAALAGAEGCAHLVAGVRVNYGTSLLRMGHLDAAREALKSVDPMLVIEWYRFVPYLNLVECELERGDVAAAQVVVAEARPVLMAINAGAGLLALRLMDAACRVFGGDASAMDELRAVAEQSRGYSQVWDEALWMQVLINGRVSEYRPQVLREYLQIMRRRRQTAIRSLRRVGQRLSQFSDFKGYGSDYTRLLTFAVEASRHEDPTGGHCYRVGQLSRLVACAAGADEDRARRIGRAAMLHDIGKSGLAPALLSRRIVVGDEDTGAVRSHAIIASELLAGADIGDEDLAEASARNHHECFDGSGFPDGLEGNAIPWVARVVSVADAFDVLTHDRPARSAGTTGEALARIKADAGSRYDPQLVGALEAVVGALSSDPQCRDAQLSAAAQALLGDEQLNGALGDMLSGRAAA